MTITIAPGKTDSWQGVYIGRSCYGKTGSPLANPYKVTEHTSEEHQRVVALYKKWLWRQINSSNAQAVAVRAELQRLKELATKGEVRLNCWCDYPQLDCHARIVKGCLEWAIREQHDFCQVRQGLKTIIAGSRTITDYAVIEAAIAQSGFTISEVVSGTAAGVDSLGEQWALKHGIPIKRMPADWNLGKRAGYLRNVAMAEYVGAEGALVCCWDGSSRGTKHMIDIARGKGLKVFIFQGLSSSPHLSSQSPSTSSK